MMRWLPLLLVFGCARKVPEEALQLQAKPERWVDGSAAEGGDGSRDRPLRQLALAPNTVFHVATGLYPLSGPLPEGVELVGGKAVVLHAEAGLEATRATLRHLAVQGGPVGLTVLGAVTLEDVAFSGQRQAGVSVADGGTLTMKGGEVVGSVPETRGVVTSGRLTVEGTLFKGALRRAVSVMGGEAVVEGAASEGAAEAVHVSGGRAEVRRTRAIAGRGPAFFVASGRLELTDVTVRGHEYAVQTAIGSELEIDGLVSDRVELGAVAAILSKVVVKRLTVTRPGVHGALELLECDSRVEDVTVTDALDFAVLVRLGKVELRRLTVRGVRDPDGSGGDGVLVRGAQARLEDLDLLDLGGVGLMAGAEASVDVTRLKCERCRIGALLIERRSTMRAKGIVSIGAREAAVSLPDDGVLELDGLEVQGGSTPIWAECAPGSRVVLRGKLPPRELLSGPCLEFPRPAAPPDSGR